VLIEEWVTVRDFSCLGFNLISSLQNFLRDWILMAEKTVELYCHCNDALPNAIAQHYLCVGTAHLSFIKFVL
jgi:hypothetical protein